MDEWSNFLPELFQGDFAERRCNMRRIRLFLASRCKAKLMITFITIDQAEIGCPRQRSEYRILPRQRISVDDRFRVDLSQIHTKTRFSFLNYMTTGDAISEFDSCTTPIFSS